MKYFYIAITRQENQQYYCYYIRVSTSDNILHRLNDIPGIMWANICYNKTSAIKTVDAWRAGFAGISSPRFEKMNDPIPF